MIAELGGQIGDYVADLVGTNVNLHGADTLSKGMQGTIGALYAVQNIPNDPASAVGNLDQSFKPKPLSMDI